MASTVNSHDRPLAGSLDTMPARARGLVRRLSSLLLPLAGLAIVTYFVAVPLVTILISSVKPQGLPGTPGWTLSHIASVFLSSDTYFLLRNTLLFAFTSVVMAITFGFSVAWLLERTDVLGREVFRTVIMAALAVPKILIAMGWILLLAPRVGLFNVLLGASADYDGPFRVYSMAGMIFVNSLALSPAAFLLAAPILARMNIELEEAAAVAGASYPKIIRRVILPLLWPAILASFSYLFVLSVVIFDIPALLGMPARIFVLSTAIYAAALPSRGLPDYGEISALSLITLLLALALVFLYLRVIKDANRFATVTGRGYRIVRVPLGRWRLFACGLLAAYCSLVIVLPLAAIVFASFQPYWSALSLESLGRLTLDNYVSLTASPALRNALGNSLIVGVLAASLVALLGFIVSWLVVRTKSPVRGFVDGMAVLPNGMPGAIVGTSLLIFYLTWGNFIPVYGTIWILVLAFITENIAYTTRVLNSSLLQIHPEMEEAASASGATRMATVIRIVVPLAAPALLTVWVWSFMSSLRNVSTALLLTGSDNRVYGVELWAYWTKGAYNAAAAMGVVLVILLVLLQGSVATLRTIRMRAVERRGAGGVPGLGSVAGAS